ncbi:MAG TPA: fused MFS/spermidine synthase [Gaiellaceae bacterium]|nr:fused MFS/spermidine synthase [Gaiellaceae bacterium]
MTDRRSLYVLVFLAGVGTLATEISASRLLAPYYGSSTIVWSNIIGLTLASLSLGYWLGGKVADRNPSPRLLGALVFLASLLVALIPFVSRPILDVAAKGLDELSAGAVIGSFFATLLLFAPPVIVLGMVAPFAIRLAIDDVATAGQVAGRLYALSTLGSLLGTFLPALVTIPLIGTQRTLLVSAVLLAAAAATLLGRRWLVATVAIAGLLAVPPGAIKSGNGDVLFEVESPYQFVQVVERGGVRRLYLNEGVAVHSLWRPDTVLTGGVWDAFLAVPAYLPHGPRRVAILGNAGGTVARAFGVYWPRAEIDGVEIDPAVSEAGRRYLGMSDNPRLHVHDADARPFLRRTDRRYDLIVVDAYHQPYVPFYLATREFFRLVREHLAPGGIVALNVATIPGDNRLERGLVGTLANEFPIVKSWPALRFNHIVLGFTSPPSTFAYPKRLAPLVGLMTRQLGPALHASDDPWTDDRAPVEWVTDRMILTYAAEGGRLDEDQLPTAP